MFPFLPLVSRHNFTTFKGQFLFLLKLTKPFQSALLRTVPGLVPKRCTNVTIGTLPEKTAVFAAKRLVAREDKSLGTTGLSTCRQSQE